MLKAVNVKDIDREEKEKYVMEYVAIYADECDDDELDQFYMAVEATVASKSKGMNKCMS